MPASLSKIEEAANFLKEKFPQGFILVVAPPIKGSTVYLARQENIKEHPPLMALSGLLQLLFKATGGEN